MNNQIVNLPWSGKMFLILGLSGVILLLGFFTDLLSELTQLGQAKAQNRQQQHLWQNEAALLKQYDNLSKQNKLTHFKVTKYTISSSLAQNALLQIGQENGLQIQSLQPEKTLQPLILPIHITVSGDYHNISQFIVDIASSRVPLVLVDFSINNANDNPTNTNILQAKFIINTYALDFSDAIKPLPLSFLINLRDPFRADAAMSLQTVPLQKLTMVGYVNSAQSTIALIKLPNGSLEAVAVGSTLGQENGVVVAITEKNILVQIANMKNSLRIPFIQ